MVDNTAAVATAAATATAAAAIAAATAMAATEAQTNRCNTRLPYERIHAVRPQNPPRIETHLRSPLPVGLFHITPNQRRLLIRGFCVQSPKRRRCLPGHHHKRRHFSEGEGSRFCRARRATSVVVPFPVLLTTPPYLYCTSEREREVLWTDWGSGFGYCFSFSYSYSYSYRYGYSYTYGYSYSCSASFSSSYGYSNNYGYS